MRKLFLTASFALCTLVPLSAGAVPPSGVTGLAAAYRNGQIYVSWDPVTDGTVAYYRVYYARQSILGNAGKYDDFEVTSGNRTEHTLTTFPKDASTLYIAVLAVSDLGEESPAFSEETAVQLTVSSPASGVSSPTGTASSDQFDILSVRAVSATGVLVTFSRPVLLNPADALQAFEIRDGSGGVLQLRRLELAGNDILIHTVRQVRGRVYQLRVGDVVRGQSSTGGAPLPINQLKSTALFTGSPDGDAPNAAPVSSSSSSVLRLPADVKGLRLRGFRTGSGTFTVTAEWALVSPQNAAYVLVRQTRDHGKTWSEAQSVASETRTVRFQGLTPGEFGVLVQVANSENLLSKGVTAFLTLSERGSPLAQTGAGALLTVLLSGGLAGWKNVGGFLKRKRK
jgi:hypothetical protein